MPIRDVAGTDSHYCLIAFDENGSERPESDGARTSDAIAHRLLADDSRVTDVFVISHGWMGDIPAAIRQYDSWVSTMLAGSTESGRMYRERFGFTPLVIGLHWPSLPFGDETLPPGHGLLDAAEPPPLESEVAAYAERIARTPAAIGALRVVLAAAYENPQATDLTPELDAAYRTLWHEAGLQAGGVGAPPGFDQDGFDPEAIVAAGRDAEAQFGLLDAGGRTANVPLILLALRQLSFWKMKDRARRFGESGAHDLLCRFQAAGSTVRFHLMGHSFGCIVASAAVAGAVDGRPLLRPVRSLFLVQGALSLWSYADAIPYGSPKGYFHRIVEHQLVDGPIVTTRSTYDTAVGDLYPLGAALRDQYLLGPEFPPYGGIGTFGIQGLPDIVDLPIQSIEFDYAFLPGQIYNIDASPVIRLGDPPAGAHSDIAHPEIAHLCWSAVDCGLGLPPLEFHERMFEASSFDVGNAFPADSWSGADVLERKFGAPSQSSEEPDFGALLSDGDELPIRGVFAAPQPPPAAAAAAADFDGEDPHWLHASIAYQRRNEPLVTGRAYVLEFDIDIVKRETALAAEQIPSKTLFPAGADAVTLTVQLTSADFDIGQDSLPLVLPRRGRSEHKARFFISPRHDGASTITAIVHRDGNFITQMTLTFDVGAARPTAPEVVSRGRQPSAARLARPRNLGISIEPAGDGYECIIWGAVQARARLAVSTPLLMSAIANVRSELMGIINHRDRSGNFVFRGRIDIPQSDCAAVLRPLANAGARLFQQVFRGPGAGPDSIQIGDFIAKHAVNAQTRLKIQVLAAKTPIPWGLLYVGDVSDDAVLSWSNFLGMRHIIEQIPLQTRLTLLDPEIPTEPHLQVSTYFNDGIDRQAHATFVAQQKQFWSGIFETREPVRVRQFTRSSDLLATLKGADNTDQLLYFYCHAQSTGLSDPGGVDSSSLVLTDARLTLADLNRNAPTRSQLAGNPLIFINACESAALSTAFYDGFVPYFMAKGARGVVGTECKTPALFATSWASDFFNRFIDGQTLGEAFLELRQDYLNRHNNPLGLCYAVYCDGDTQITPALAHRRTPVAPEPQPQGA